VLGLIRSVAGLGLFQGGEPQVAVRMIDRVNREGRSTFRFGITNVGRIALYDYGLITFEARDVRAVTSFAYAEPGRRLAPGEGFVTEFELPGPMIPELAQTNRMTLYFQRPGLSSWIDSVQWGSNLPQLRGLQRRLSGLARFRSQYIYRSEWNAPMGGGIIN
jgi:hypothetical protein